MARKFTTEEAYDASECGEPIMLAHEDVVRICGRQESADCAPHLFYEEHQLNSAQPVDAAVLLGWLGY